MGIDQIQIITIREEIQEIIGKVVMATFEILNKHNYNHINYFG